MWNFRGQSVVPLAKATHTLNVIVGYHNIRGLNHKFEQIQGLLCHQPIDVLCLNETFLDDSTGNSKINIEGCKYSVIGIVMGVVYSCI